MKKQVIQFSSASVTFYFNASFDYLQKLVRQDNSFVITDENIFSKYSKLFKDWKTITIKPGEQYKVQSTVDDIINQLISFGADRKSFLIGVGGGVVTDITGYAASIFLRGIKFGFVPTSVLAMVDAAIGGKNGIDVGVYKNMVGVIRQPEFILYDYSLLKTLPNEEWINGFAEIIKHACIKDAVMFKMLEKYSLDDFQKNNLLLSKLIQQNALLKSEIVQKDEFEQGERKLLNFGHTLGHAIENTYQLPHGHAVAIGMVGAAYISEKYAGFEETEKLLAAIEKYKLPRFMKFDVKKVLQVMQADKKRIKDVLHYVLLQKTGKGIIKELAIKDIEPVIEKVSK